MKILILFVLVIVEFLETQSFAQKEPSPYTVNPLIGDTLTLEERDYYKLFPQIEGFQLAVFFLNPDSTLNANILYSEDRVLKDTLIESYKSLKSLNYHIYARKALENELPKSAFNYQAAGYENGAEVSAYLIDGRETSGELLSVRENSILLLNPECDERLLKPECIYHINASEIDKLTIKGNSNVIVGIGLGLLVSVVAAAITYQANYESSGFGGPDEETIIQLSILTVCCVGIGAAIGILTSTPDEVIEPFSEDDIVGLRSYSRFLEAEPNQLKKIE